MIFPEYLCNYNFTFAFTNSPSVCLSKSSSHLLNACLMNTNGTKKEFNSKIQLEAKLLYPLELLPLDPMLNKSCNIEHCGHKMHQVDSNMMLSQY